MSPLGQMSAYPKNITTNLQYFYLQEMKTDKPKNEILNSNRDKSRKIKQDETDKNRLTKKVNQNTETDRNKIVQYVKQSSETDRNQKAIKLPKTNTINHVICNAAVSQAMSIAEKHGLKLLPGPRTFTFTPADAIIAQLKSQSYNIPAGGFPHTTAYYRVVWCNIAEQLSRTSGWYPGGYDEVTWVECWSKLRREGVCGVWYFDRLYLWGILHCIQKNALLISPKTELNKLIAKQVWHNKSSILKPIRTLPPSVLTFHKIISIPPLPKRGVEPEKLELSAQSSSAFGGSQNDDPPLILAYKHSKYYNMMLRTPSQIRQSVKLFRKLEEDKHSELCANQNVYAKFSLSDLNLSCTAESNFSEGYENLNSVSDDNGKIASKERPAGRASSRKRALTDDSSILPSQRRKLNNGDAALPSSYPNLQIHDNAYRDPSCRNTIVNKDVPIVMQDGIRLAKRFHIALLPGKPNEGNGNCFIESVMDQISSRKCYREVLRESPLYYRRKWIKKAEKAARKTNFYPGGFTATQWQDGWDRLLEDGIYEIDYFGDLMIPGIMHCIQKHALVFHTSLYRQHSSQLVIRGDVFGGKVPPNTPPLVLAYDGNHYESLLPATSLDRKRTQYMVDHWEELVGSDMRELLLKIPGYSDEDTDSTDLGSSITSDDESYSNQCFSTNLV